MGKDVVRDILDNFNCLNNQAGGDEPDSPGPLNKKLFDEPVVDLP